MKYLSSKLICMQSKRERPGRPRPFTVPNYREFKITTIEEGKRFIGSLGIGYVNRRSEQSVSDWFCKKRSLHWPFAIETFEKYGGGARFIGPSHQLSPQS